MSMPTITHGTGTRFRAITDMIQSVALEQTAISHILNAEGEKIQRVVAMPGVSVAQLIETNNSVESLLETIARLEQALHAKLSLFEDCLCCYEPEAEDGE